MKILDEEEKLVLEVDGKEVEYEILFTFESDDTNKLYVGYTDNSIAANGRKNIYVGAYDRSLGTNKLEEIKTEEEMNMVREVLEKIDRETK